MSLSFTNDQCTSCKIILHEKGIINDKYLEIFSPKDRVFRIGREMERGTFIRLKVLDHALDMIASPIILSIGCGFDTRFLKRRDKCMYVDVDLPSIINLKKEMIKACNEEMIEYLSIATNIAQDSLEWLDIYSAIEGVTFLMECFLMYLKIDDQKSLLLRISETFMKGTKLLIFNSILYKNNRFSNTMLKNLSPLIENDDIGDITYFYRDLGWTLKEFKNLNSEFKNLSMLGMYDEDILKLNGHLLSLDEYEEWNMMGSHYYFAILELL